MPKKAYVEKSTARLAAVQALYQEAISQTPFPQLIKDFSQKLAMDTTRDEQTEETSEKDHILFTHLVEETLRHKTQIDKVIQEHLPKGWTFDRVELLLIIILEVALYELLYEQSMHPNMIVSEYVDIAHAFYGGKETAFVNGLLNEVAKNPWKEGTKSTS